jgi:hypothetical protein
MATSTSHENSVLSGEKTYDLDLNAVRELPVTAGACLSEFVSDRGGESLEAWEALERAAVGLLVSAVRAVANIDSVGFGAPSSARPPTAVLGQLRVIVDQVDRSAQGLSDASQRWGDRVDGELASPSYATPTRKPRHNSSCSPGSCAPSRRFGLPTHAWIRCTQRRA